MTQFYFPPSAKRQKKKVNMHVHVRTRRWPRPPADLKRLEVIHSIPSTISAYIQKVMPDCEVAATSTRSIAVSLATTARDSTITCQINSLSLLLLPSPIRSYIASVLNFLIYQFHGIVPSSRGCQKKNSCVQDGIKGHGWR